MKNKLFKNASLLVFVFSLSQANAFSLDNKYTGVTKEGKECSVVVSHIVKEGSAHYEFTLFEKKNEVFNSTHSKGVVDYYLTEYDYFQEDIVVDGFFGKKLYEIDIRANEDEITLFRIIRWRFLTGSSFATAFEKIKCFVKL
jgi:hypothetical protein